MMFKMLDTIFDFRKIFFFMIFQNFNGARPSFKLRLQKIYQYRSALCLLCKLLVLLSHLTFLSIPAYTQQ